MPNGSGGSVIQVAKDFVPRVSVVVASCRGRGLLHACLKSLEGQCNEARAEIIVARDCDPEEIDELTELYPFARFIANPGAAIPRLRAAGMAAARGAVVALTEDHCLPCRDWVRQLVNALQDGTEVVGGAMDNAQRERAIDWAAYFSEYGFFGDNGDSRALRPLLTAANVAYSRRVVDEVIKRAQEGEWENVIHDALFAQGLQLLFLKPAMVYQNQNYRFWDFCRDRFVHGRDYARSRLLNNAARRWLYLAGVAVLPPLLLVRVARISASRYRRPFLLALPITFAFLAAWALGEAVGYCYGPAKASPNGK